MIGTKTPFRMSFVGGGSDLKDFYSRYTGSVLSTTINKFMYIFIHPYFDQRIQVKYSKTELVESINDITHPIVREVLKEFKVNGIDINSIADIPAGTGLGSSSSYTVGLLHALYLYKNKLFDKELLARKASEIEIDVLKEPIGKQDQYAASYGGLNVIRFYKGGKVAVNPVKISNNTFKEFESSLLLFFTGKTRDASSILNDQKKNIINQKEKFDIQLEMTKLVDQAKNYLIQGDIRSFGEVLDVNWKLKRQLSKKITDSMIDDLYSFALKKGAIGGKILGAGGGGFLLLLAEKKNHAKIRNEFKNFKEVEFSFEKSGTKSINF